MRMSRLLPLYTLGQVHNTMRLVHVSSVIFLNTAFKTQLHDLATEQKYHAGFALLKCLKGKNIILWNKE